MSNTTIKELTDLIAKFLEEKPDFQVEYEIEMPKWRYWGIPEHWKKTRFIFGWTTERDSNGKFYAVKYREFHDGSFKLSKSVAFGRRKIAKARSKKWFDQYYRDSS